jgi:hypothetical protein
MAVVVDLAAPEPLARRKEPGALQQPVALQPELIRPRERAAARDRPEAVEVAGAEELQQPPVRRLDRALGPPQLTQLRRRQELIPPHISDKSDVPRLHDAWH